VHVGGMQGRVGKGIGVECSAVQGTEATYVRPVERRTPARKAETVSVLSQAVTDVLSV